MFKYIALTLMLVFGDDLLASEIELMPKSKIFISDDEKFLGEVFWSHIKSLDFDEAINTGKIIDKKYSNHIHAETFFEVTEIIIKVRGTNYETLRDFLLLEHKRREWEFFSFYGSLEQVDMATMIDDVVVGLEKLEKSREANFLKDEVIYRLALSYQTSGSYGVNRFDEAIALFYKIIEEYPDSDLVDDAKFGVITAHIARDYATGRLAPSVEGKALVLKEFIAENPSSNKVVEARYKLATEYYFNRDYNNAISEYKEILNSNTKNNSLLVEVLSDLIYWCHDESSYDCNREKYIKTMEERFPHINYIN